MGSKLGLATIWPGDAIQKLERAWVQTPYQLVSIARSPGGVKTIAELTGISPEEVERLIEQSISLLSDEEISQLSSRIDPGDMPLGAFPPKS